MYEAYEAISFNLYTLRLCAISGVVTCRRVQPAQACTPICLANILEKQNLQASMLITAVYVRWIFTGGLT